VADIMQKKYSIVIVGGASTFTPGIVKSLINNNPELPLKRLVLVDINKERLEIMGKFVEIMMNEYLPNVQVSWTCNRKEGFCGADFIFAQIRPGGLEQRDLDEKIPLKYGLVGQETCGAGGFAFAMRSILDMIEIAKDVVKYCKDAWILNYSNPESMISEALMRAVPEAKVLCLCDMPIGQELSLAKLIGMPREELTFKYFGLNHFGWFTNIYDRKGNDYLPKIKKAVLDGEITTLLPEESARDPYWDDVFERIVKMIKFFPDYIPLTYIQYYLFPDEMVEKANPNYTRANYVMDNRMKNVYEECKRVIEQGSVKGSSLDTSVHGEYIIGVAKAISNDTKERFIVNVRNNGAISNFRHDAVVEIPCYIGSYGVEPIAVGEIPDFQKGLMEIEKAYEILAVEACLEGSYEKAVNGKLKWRNFGKQKRRIISSLGQ
jgi:maltose-6'-phosphate glucosidase